MSTFTSYDLVRDMVNNKGCYPGDPQALAIYEYKGMGGIVWKVCMDAPCVAEFHTSPYVTGIVLLWSQKAGLVQQPTKPNEVRDGE